MPAVRLQRLIAEAGLASRRQAEEWIRDGRVRLNGAVATLGDQAVRGRDEVLVDGRPLPRPSERQYWLLNKPAGYTVSLEDRHARHLITELLPSGVGRLFPVGRLDRETRGLLLMTDDGELAHQLMHPRYGVPKTYLAWVDGWPTAERLKRMRRGITFDDGALRAQTVTIVRQEAGRTLLSLVLTEGRKREIRRLLQAIGHPVQDLVRTTYGPLTLEGVPEGGARPLSAAEVRTLRAHLRERTAAAGTPVRREREESRSYRGRHRPAAPDIGRHHRLESSGSRDSFGHR